MTDKKTETPLPIGLQGNPHVKPVIEWGVFFELRKKAQELLKISQFVEEQLLSSGVLKYYYESDIITEPPVQEGEEPKKTLRPDFWTK